MHIGQGIGTNTAHVEAHRLEEQMDERGEQMDHTSHEVQKRAQAQAPFNATPETT